MLDEGKREQVVEYCRSFRDAKQFRQIIGILIICTIFSRTFAADI